MKLRVAVSIIALATAPAMAQKSKHQAQSDHYTLMTAYASAFPMAIIAEQNCPGVAANMGKLLMLRTMAKISDEEEPMNKKEMEEAAASLRKGLAKNGALVWCANAWSLIGPDGSTMPGLITKP